MKRPELITHMTVGAIGAIGQAGLLAHTLESYPFKILSSPPGEFYSSAGWTIFFIAPALSLLAACFLRVGLLRRIDSPLTTAIPVTACPILFWTLFRLAFLMSGFRYGEYGRNDLVTTSSVESDFSNLVLLLTVFGFAIGLVSGFFVRFVFKNVPKLSPA